MFERLGIPRPLGMRQSIFAWAWAGLDLAAEQSEFRGRGRPRSTPDEATNRRRAEFILKLAREQDLGLSDLDTKTLDKLMKITRGKKPSLFPEWEKGDARSIRTSVRRGMKSLRELQAPLAKHFLEGLLSLGSVTNGYAMPTRRPSDFLSWGWVRCPSSPEELAEIEHLRASLQNPLQAISDERIIDRLFASLFLPT